ncbi:thiol-disulfide oxidoreductase DCC family protein [Solitalea koreensis]|uniref:Predicted thiol-disulfide oxidoreductase YuxK, DCC family n=1 Tax=Solitalea koreensis TaxID=543615 RepID=A0A521BLP0_9SPHI|nr:DCC1-like thiol-disulfide oxidoreductase family protein [Solitalea koreensis]SMO48009.1 Predicted thiol-disulfide oxidoreductase YuxK, DCC family [Solitalea koreensis]
MNKEENLIVLFDGVCNLCNSTVQFIIKNDPSGKFKFAALQSETGQQFSRRLNLPTDQFGTFILIKNNKPHLRSSGALLVLKELGGIYLLLYIFIIIPRPIRDYFYTIIARNRYKWFGRRNECMVPSPELRSRFLS